ncbi:sulfate adenylyltransferase (ADP) / ATP adenylyltransferase, partial [Phenoliferia sp. Uapishka_3]
MAFNDSTLPALSAKAFQDALEGDYIKLFAATSTHTSFYPPALSHLVHVCPDIASKPAVPPTTPNLSDRPKRDPFQGPDYGRGEKIVELDVTADNGEPTTYACLQNMNALAPEHFLCTPRDFRSQTSDLLREDLLVAWRIVGAYAKEGRETMCFFNGGPLAGASQPHLHVQFIPFQRGAPGPEALARSLPPSSLPRALPLPYLHLCVSLPDLPSDPTLLSKALFTTYSSLLAASNSYRARLAEKDLPPAGPKRASYNLFLSKSHMHLIPRTNRLAVIPRIASKTSTSGEDWSISVNGLAYLTYWYVGTREEGTDLESYGLARVLVESGYDTKLWDEFQ